MCGIVGYTGPRQALPLVLEGLRRLEYRGYDSAGVAVLDGEGGLAIAKKAGVLGNLEHFIDSGDVALAGFTGMGHTRWATHGGPTDRNAHPHTDSSGRVAVIHNGIIENFVSLRKDLESRGIEMRSDTDTEVVAHLLGQAFDRGLRPATCRPAWPPSAELWTVRSRWSRHTRTCRACWLLPAGTHRW